MKPMSVTIQVTAIEQYKVVLTFKSVNSWLVIEQYFHVVLFIMM